MFELTLLIMAAGMGSRYGGLKQLDKVGPQGETIIDYSVYDAISSGFTKIVFVIRKDFEKKFIENISSKYAGKIDIEYAFQDINDIPKKFNLPRNRQKPWGTAHAILSARNLITSSFVVINADDFYGRESFQSISDFYRNNNCFCMVSFDLNNTLSEFGSVTRGICKVVNNNLLSVEETEGIIRTDNSILCSNKKKYTGFEPVSMNMWGFSPRLFDFLKLEFDNFLESKIEDPKSEYLIPTVISKLIDSKIETVKVINSKSSWFGITYLDDKPYVIKNLSKLIKSGKYKSPLF